MVGAITLIGTGATFLALLLSYIYYVNSNRPTAAEVSEAAQRRFPREQILGTDLHAENVVKVIVTAKYDWLDQYDDAEKQRIQAFLQGVFIGKGEVVIHFQKPAISPPQDKLEEHPYYGEHLTFEGKWAGTGPLEIQATEESLVVNFGIYTETAEDGAAAVAGMLNLVSKMVDHLIEEQVMDEPNEIPPIDELFSGDRLEDGREPVTPVSEIPDLDSFKHSKIE